MSPALLSRGQWEHEAASSKTLMVTAPAIMVPPAPAPSIMVTTAAAAHVVAVAMTASDLDHRVVLRGERRDAQSGGSGGGHRQRCEQRETNQSNAFHAVSSHRKIAIWGTISRSWICSACAKRPEIVMLIAADCRIFPSSKRHLASRFTSSSGMSGNLPPRS
jgi:hypothetical protein